MLLGYGAVGKCFAEIVLREFPKINLIVMDIFDHQDKRFKFIKNKVTRENIHDIPKFLEKGDVLVDLSINIDVTTLWKICNSNGIRFVSTAMEEWGDSEDPTSYPETIEEMYLCSIPFLQDEVRKMDCYDKEKGTTAVLEHGMNPGLISHFAKKALLDAAEYFLSKKDEKGWEDLAFDLIKKYLTEKNFPKLAQAMGLHTIHCSEIDNQFVTNPPKDYLKTFYNTWSCRGFLTEALIPIQVAKGSHETEESEEFPSVRDNTVIMSWAPSYHYAAKSWVPFENIEGLLIPHGESFTIRDYFSDEETGYRPTHAFVYSANQYAKEFIRNVPPETTIQDCDPKCVILDPKNFDLHGYDKVGSLLIFDKNRAWWSGTIMDEFDSQLLFGKKFGPTAIQVAAGCFAAFAWACNNPDSGSRWAEDMDTEYILKLAAPYLGRVYSNFADLSETHIKDCKKFDQFLSKKYEGKIMKK